MKEALKQAVRQSEEHQDKAIVRFVEYLLIRQISRIPLLLGPPLQGKGHRKGGTFPDFAIHGDGSSMVLNDLRHNVQPHAQTGDPSLPGTSSPVEALKDFLALLSRDAQAMIAHADRDRIFGGIEVHFDHLGTGRIFDGIADQVGEDLP
jgi:hypothetical protein